MHHKIQIQISEGYGFNAQSQFLLIVNASTDNEAITQMQKFIRSQLYQGVDTLNISLTGSVNDVDSKQSALLKYRGKSIVIAGNVFTYFSIFKRYNWDMIDPQDALVLLMNGTSFMFCGVQSPEDRDSFAKWTELMRYPTELGGKTVHSLVQHKNRGALLKSIRSGPSPDIFALELRNQYACSSRFGLFRSLTEKLQDNGNSLSKKLDKQAPMRRFLIASEGGDGEEQDHSVGTVSVVEGQSRSTNCMVSYPSIVNSRGTIRTHQMVMMVASIPFHILVVIFWNVVRAVSSDGIAAEVMYRNLPGFYNPLEFDGDRSYGEGNEKGGRLISYKVRSA
jgi:hypothetical protein